jgi:hypothetical protein
VRLVQNQQLIIIICFKSGVVVDNFNSMHTVLEENFTQFNYLDLSNGGWRL